MWRRSLALSRTDFLKRDGASKIRTPFKSRVRLRWKCAMPLYQPNKDIKRQADNDLSFHDGLAASWLSPTEIDQCKPSRLLEKLKPWNAYNLVKIIANGRGDHAWRIQSLRARKQESKFHLQRSYTLRGQSVKTEVLSEEVFRRW